MFHVCVYCTPDHVYEQWREKTCSCEQKPPRCIGKASTWLHNLLQFPMKMSHDRVSSFFSLSLCSKNILRMDFSVVLLVSIATQSMVADRFFVSSVLLWCFQAITPFHLVCIEFFSKITSTYVNLHFCANTLKWSYLLHCWNENKHLETQKNSAEQKKRAMVDISCKQKGKTTAAV